jgi:hypothetical protein
MKTVKYITLFLGSITIIYFLLHYVNVGDNVFSDVVTFLSITIGFGITSLSIIATSKFSSNLYAMEDRSNNSRTLLHVIVYKFRSSIILFTTTIALIFFYYIFSKNCMRCNVNLLLNINIISLLKAVIEYLTIWSFGLFLSLVITFSKFVIKSAIGESRIE